MPTIDDLFSELESIRKDIEHIKIVQDRIMEVLLAALFELDPKQANEIQKLADEAKKNKQ